jgi:uncharacterized membrane protein
MDEEILDYFLYPKKTGYDFQKTLLYAAVLVAAVYGIYKLLKRLKVKIDKRLAFGVAPYVVFGGALRVLEDVGIVSSYMFVTPVIYVLVFLVTFAVLLLSVSVERKTGVPYFKILFIVGCLLSAVTALLPFKNLYGAAIVMVLFAPWLVALRFFKWGAANKAVSLLHVFDATTTSVALYFFGFYEQHVVPTLFIGLFGPFSFIVLKVVAIVVVLLLIDRFGGKGKKNEEFKDYLKLVIGILGGATACRDFMALAVLA